MTRPRFMTTADMERAFTELEKRVEMLEARNLRDWFAGQALASGLINEEPGDAQMAQLGLPKDAPQEQVVATIAYRLAGAMIVAGKAGAA